MSSAVELSVNRSSSIDYKQLRKRKCRLLFINCQIVRDLMTFSLDPHRTAPFGAVWFGSILTLVK